MLRNLILSALRALKKDKFFSFLNIIGLSIGMGVFLLIALYVKFERSYEAFIPDANNIYRVTLSSYLNKDLVMASAENYPGVGPALANELPRVKSFARLYNLGYKNNVIITYEDAKPEPIAYKHRRFLYADSSFLPLMQYTMVAGDRNTALAEPFTAVISEKYARMYFGNENPLGQFLRMQDDDYNNELVKVTGIFKDLPDNTHLNFDILFSYKTLFARGEGATARYEQSWQRKDMYTFIKVQAGTNPGELEKQFSSIIDKYNPSAKERNQLDVLTLQPIRDIHLTSTLAEEFAPNGDERIVLFLAIIGIFILIIAWINYINLATAKAMDRANEVGVRKVMGAFKVQLISQFLTESALINFIAISLAVLLTFLSLPYFNNLSGLSLNASYLVQNWFILLMLILWFAGTFLSGLYPAFVLSSFKPVTVLKGKLRSSRSGLLLRKSLVVFQFMASVALIAGTLVVFDQLNFMQKRDLGMNIDQVLVIERPGIAPPDRNAFNSSIDVFRNELEKDKSIISMSTSLTVPGKQREYKSIVKKYGEHDDAGISVRVNSMDYDFLNVFKMKLIAGREFSPDYKIDEDTSVIITESASRLLGYANPNEAIGKTVTIEEFQWSPIIVGVVNDYHQVSLKKALEPTLFFCTRYGGEFYSVRLSTNNLLNSVDHVRESWQRAFPGNPFEYFFLDDFFNQQYENERKFGKLFTLFASMAIVVGCLGLMGLSAFTATQRTKEIGIRKVLGSTVGSIFVLLTKEYLILISLAFIIAVPLVYVVMRNWIASFPYQTNIHWSIFIFSGGIVLLIALLTVSFQTIRAARANPVTSLRYE
jgi:putative ABC transport system permease protein